MRTCCISLVGAVLTLGILGGCANSDDQSDARLAGARMQNQDAAKDLLREAEEAERNHNYAHAVEVYRYLQGFPDSSRPRDLDRRIRRDKARLAESGRSDSI